MVEVSKRIADLPPAKRKLLERMMADRAAAGDKEQDPNAPPPARTDTQGSGLIFDEGLTGTDKKKNYKQFYDDVTRQLNESEFGQFSYFLNWGYVADHNPTYSVVDLPDYQINKNSVRLVLELVGDCDVEGKHVLDVGCGRGGTLSVINQFFNPASLTGLDLSSEAVAFNKKTHRYKNTQFFQGDAENLPFDDGAFDIVTNVESSHSYPNIDAFYAGVYRVLKPGGYFLYTDMLNREEVDHTMAAIPDLGFIIERDTDIGTNVLLSCDEVAESRAAAFQDDNNRELMSEFLCMPGSTQYEDMRRGVLQYRIWKIRKPA